MADSDGDTQATFDTVSWDAPASPPGADTPSGDGSADPSSAATTAPPAGTTTEGEGVREGPVPFDRHKAILDGERQKHTDLETKWKRVEWADALVQNGLTPEQAKEALAIHGHLTGNPVAFFESFLQQTEAHPELAAQVRSIAARVLGGSANGAPPAAAHTDAEPQPDFYVENPDGSRTPFMSAPQLAKWRTWHDQALDRKFEDRFGPLERSEQARQTEQATQQLRTKIYAETKSELDAMRQQPHFKEHESDVKAYLAEQNWALTLPQAWLHVLQTKVLPGIGHTERERAIAEMRQRAHASSVNPKGGAPSTPARPKGFDDPALKWG